MANALRDLSKIGGKKRALLITSADAAITAAALLAALLLRFSVEEAASFREHLPHLLLLLVACRVVCNLSFRLHRWSFRFSGLTDGARVAMAGVSGTALFVLLMHFLEPGLTIALGRAVLALELLLSTTLMAAVRFAPRLGLVYWRDLWRERRPEAIPTAILGAGAAGEMLLRGLRSGEHDYRIVGFIDDEEAKHGHVVGGKTVLGGVADLPGLVERYRICQILIAIPRLPAEKVREILELSTDYKLRFQILPYSFREIHEQSASAQLRDLTPQDLLYREELSFKHGPESKLLGEGVQMVTGAAGSIGSEVCSQLLEAGARRLVMVDVDENGLYLLERRLERRHPDCVVITEVADVRDAVRLETLFRRHRPTDVFQAAARKQVPLMEGAPCEAVKTNVFGTLNLARAAAELGARRFVYMSTDKAVKPVNVMGATKRLGEMLMRRLNETSRTRFIVVRFGNVLDSAGSVVPLFREQIEAGGPVTVTHRDARRYFMTISEAVGVVLRAAYGDYGGLCVLEMGDQIRIAHLAKLMITMSGRAPDVDVKIAYTGLRPGEKLIEELIDDGEEVVQRIDSKIRVVESPAPDGDLLAEIEPLWQAAAADDHEAVLRLLRQLVPSYRPFQPAESRPELVAQVL